MFVFVFFKDDIKMNIFLQNAASYYVWIQLSYSEKLRKKNLILLLLKRFSEQSYPQAWGCRELGVNLLSFLLGVSQVDDMLHGARWGQEDEVFPESDAINRSFHLLHAVELGALQ